MKEYAKRLKYEREQRSWSQEQLAEMIGSIRTNVSRWERGVTFPSLYFRQKLSELFGKSPEELGLFRTTSDNKVNPSEQHGEVQDLPVSHLEALPLLRYLPPQRNPLFIDWEEILMYLHSSLDAGENGALAQTLVISSLEGIRQSLLSKCTGHFPLATYSRSAEPAGRLIDLEKTRSEGEIIILIIQTINDSKKK